MPAKFRADSTFTIEGWGMVVAGEILEGVVKRGMFVRIPSWPSRMRISDVSSIRRADRKPSDVGLVFASEVEGDFARWRELDLKNQILEIDNDNG